jgi:hypothetical protein
MREKMRGMPPLPLGDELSEACADNDSPDKVVAHESCDALRDDDLLELDNEFDTSVLELQEFILAASSRAARF